jgi:hypothetical protein
MADEPRSDQQGAAGAEPARSDDGARVREAAATPRAGFLTLLRDLVSFDRRALLILVYVPLALTVMEYFFIRRTLDKWTTPLWIGKLLGDVAKRYPTVPPGLLPWLWWAAGCLVVMILVPMLLLKVVAGTGPRATGLKVRGTGRDAWLYLGLFVIFAPVVWLVSQRAEFRETYPFYRVRGEYGWDLVAFEAAYFLQFLSVEYFFRGFLVLGLKPALGRASILVMLAPYCMIHFHKPMLEAMGAVGAGVVLGSLSWRTGTVVYGWFLHYGVALSMDLLSLHAQGKI